MNLDALNKFLNDASVVTYAGNGKRVKSDKKGFYDLEYSEGEFYYRDSFVGYLSSHGQETVWYQDKPVWMCSYAGGMRGDRKDDPQFAHETFEFLKSALKANKTGTEFQPRGPQDFNHGEWEYKNDRNGNISSFQGHEAITFRGDLVFVHDYFGGLLKDGRR